MSDKERDDAIKGLSNRVSELEKTVNSLASELKGGKDNMAAIKQKTDKPSSIDGGSDWDKT